MRRFGIIALFTIILALGLSVLLRRGSETAIESSAPEPLPAFTVAAELTAAGLEPYRLRVPKDHRVRILIHAGTESGAGLLTLSGYEDRLDAIGIGPGLARELAFVSDRPGDDFGFLLGEDLVGRLEVTGSHLEQGHE